MTTDHPVAILPVDPIGNGTDEDTRPGSNAATNRKLDKLTAIVQSQSETQLLVYSAVQAMDARLAKMERALHWRISPATVQTLVVSAGTMAAASLVLVGLAAWWWLTK